MIATLLAGWDHGRMMDDNTGGGWWLMGIGMLVLVIAAVAVVWLIARSTHPGGVAPPGDPNVAARRILGERLARGEIDPDEYQERISHLT